MRRVRPLKTPLDQIQEEKEWQNTVYYKGGENDRTEKPELGRQVEYRK